MSSLPRLLRGGPQHGRPRLPHRHHRRVKDEGSDFLLNIYATPLPKGTVHHLIYGAIEKGPFSLKGENDGVVTVVSETDLRVKESTTSFRHLLHEHTEILQKQETLDWVLELLKK
ncbi:hypothetical protein [Verrucomicrobium spinosum]|uniref:hypothetical protein n=1 Tax=Verrucomicrobium spinosum TaxID=2736 RepID=UPI000946578F|nr:hypothetical protein [Verrucomicrobium spinosum]